MALANDSYRGVVLHDSTDVLNLAWTSDERDFLAVDLQRVLAAQLSDEAGSGLPSVNSYLVQDPYGEQILGPAVRTMFPAARGCGVTAAAGAIAALHALALLARSRPVYIVGDVYPDLPHWVGVFGGRCVSRHDAGGGTDHASNARALGAGLVLLERPSLTGAQVDLPELRALCAALPDTIVVVDESYANYYPVSFSAVPLAAELDNVVVVRGLAKGYGMGGLRLAYCVAAPGPTALVRSVLAPMLPSSLSLRLGGAILSLGDIAGPLRERVAQAGEQTAAAFAAAGLAGARPACAHVPFLFLPAEDDPTAVALRAAGVLGKRHTYWSESAHENRFRYRLSLPLRHDRMAQLRQRLAARVG